MLNKIILSLFFALFCISVVNTAHSQRNIRQIRNQHTSNHAVSNRGSLGRGHTSREGSKDPVVNKRLAGIARYIVHKYDWTILATLSSRIYNPGNPFTSVRAVSDGDNETSTGQPYFYMRDDEFSTHDIASDDRVSMTMTLEQDGSCSKRRIDPQSAKCSWTVITGNFRYVARGTDEYASAYRYLAYRHPDIESCQTPSRYSIGTIDVFDVMIMAGSHELECIPLKAYYETEPQWQD